MKCKLAHISDLHFGVIPKSIHSYFSKRAIGVANLLFNRKNNSMNKRSFSLPKFFKENGVTDVLITGDVSCTSFHKEFLLGEKLKQEFMDYGMKVYAIPGNHDHYTDRAYKNKVFYRYFSSNFSNKNENLLEKTSSKKNIASSNNDPLSPFDFNLKDHLVTHTKLLENCHLVALDTTLSTPFYLSTGLFSEKCEKNLLRLLKEIPKNDTIFLTNHFPFFSNDGNRRALQRRDALKSIIQDHPNINLYLHGHTHRHTLANLRSERLPIISDSGSISSKSHGSFDIIEIDTNSFSLETYFFDHKIHQENLTNSTSLDKQTPPWKTTAKHCWEFR